jgi:hypothetical protein
VLLLHCPLEAHAPLEHQLAAYRHGCALCLLPCAQRRHVPLCARWGGGATVGTRIACVVPISIHLCLQLSQH